MKNKKGSVATDKVIALVLVLLVIVAVFALIFKYDKIVSWIKALPEYRYEEDEEVVVERGDKVGKDICPVKVARILKGGKVGGGPINFCRDDDCGKFKLIESKLKWTGSDAEAKIEVEQYSDDTIGEVTAGKVKIKQEVLEKRGKLYNEVKKDLPEIIFLLRLDGAHYVAGNFICRDKELEIPCENEIATIQDDFIYLQNSKTNLFLDKITVGEIWIKLNVSYLPGYGTDIGTLKGRKIVIKPEYLDTCKNFRENCNEFLIHLPSNIEFLPTLDELRLLNNAEIDLEFKRVCRTNEGMKEYEKELEYIKAGMLSRGYSNELKLVFPGGTFDSNDIVFLRWNFKLQRPELIIRPNGNEIKEQWINSPDDEIFKKGALEKDIAQQDIDIIKNILYSEDPLRFSSQLAMALSYERCSFNNDKIYHLSLKKINNLLYSLDNAPKPKPDFEIKIGKRSTSLRLGKIEVGIIYYKGEETDLYIDRIYTNCRYWEIKEKFQETFFDNLLAKLNEKCVVYFEDEEKIRKSYYPEYQILKKLEGKKIVDAGIGEGHNYVVQENEK